MTIIKSFEGQKKSEYANPVLKQLEKIMESSLGEENRADILANREFFAFEDNKFSLHHDHSELIDGILGLDVFGVEQKLFRRARALLPRGDIASWGRRMHEVNQTWVGLHPKTLLTPYSQIYKILNLLNPKEGQVFVDLGAAYGRVGLVLKSFCPKAKFLGYEYVKERVTEGNRMFEKLHCPNAKLIAQDLFDDDFEIPEADFFFIYDFGLPSQIEKTIKQLSKISQLKRIKIVVRGDASTELLSKNFSLFNRGLLTQKTEYFSVFSFY